MSLRGLLYCYSVLRKLYMTPTFSEKLVLEPTIKD